MKFVSEPFNRHITGDIELAQQPGNGTDFGPDEPVIYLIGYRGKYFLTRYSMLNIQYPMASRLQSTSNESLSHAAYLGLGSNLGDRAANMLRALKELRDAGLNLTAISSIYETTPVDFPDQPDFLNMAVAVSAPMIEPFSLLRLCLAVEARLGRVRLTPKGARTIDIDLLLFDGAVIEDVRDGLWLTLPHPRLHLRGFALAPLAEIAPELCHPVSGKTIRRLLDDLKDSSSVSIYAG